MRSDKHTQPVRQCRDCRGRVLWTLTINDRWMPLALPPTQVGNVAVTRDSGGIHAVVLNPTEAQQRRDLGQRLYLPHAAICPRRATRTRRQVARLQ